MKVTFLGTGTSQGVPVILCDCSVCQSSDPKDNRLRSSVYVQYQGLHIVIDTGPDFRQQMLRAHIPRIDALLITHAHKDHTAGLDDIRAFNFRQQMDIPLYARQEAIEQIQKEFEYIFAAYKYPGIPQLKTCAIDQEPFKINNITIEPIPVMHYKLPVLGFRFGPFAYITDANHIDQEQIQKLKGIDTIVVNALQKEPHVSHFTLEQALEFIQQINPKQAYLTHISHKMGLHEEVSKELPPNVSFAFDGLTLQI